MTKPSEPFDRRFWRQVDTDGMNYTTCWFWTGHIAGSGYGYMRIWDGSRKQRWRFELAHRMAWILTKRSPIPEGMNICHRCDEKSCVNPGHLFLGTPSDNRQDMLRKGLSPKFQRATCKRGHVLQQRHMRKGNRECRQCAADRMRRKRATQRREIDRVVIR